MSGPRCEDGAIRVELVFGIVGSLVGLIGLVVAWLAWQAPRSVDPRSAPSYEGEIQHYSGGDAFLAFLEENAGRRVRIDAWLGPDFEIPIEGQWLAADHFPLWDSSCVPAAEGAAPDSSLCEDGTYVNEIRIAGMEGLQDSPLTYQHGTWSLQGYFAVQGQVDEAQGVATWVVLPIPLEEAV